MCYGRGVTPLHDYELRAIKGYFQQGYEVVSTIMIYSINLMSTIGYIYSTLILSRIPCIYLNFFIKLTREDFMSPYIFFCT